MEDNYDMDYEPCTIKSFKHNGHLHRTWLSNWRIPVSQLSPLHAAEGMLVLVNDQTPIQEADGKLWTSKVPAISFFIPGQWFNVVALLEESGVRYYCNVASPPYLEQGVLTYIDYDLDVIVTADRGVHVVDREEYARHRQLYHYPRLVDQKVRAGLQAVTRRIEEGAPPFNEQEVLHKYYEAWKMR